MTAAGTSDEIRLRMKVKRIKRLTDMINRRMKRIAMVNGSWFKLFKMYDKKQSGDISFDIFTNIVYNELQITKLELTPGELRLVWDVLDRAGSNAVSVADFASFMRRIERNRVDNVIVDAVEEQLARRWRAIGRATELCPASASLHHSKSDGSICTSLRTHRTIGGYSSLNRNKTFQMGRPPENNELIQAMIPRLKHDLVSRQEQKLKLFETLSNGGERYPLMQKPRRADCPFAVDPSDESRSLREQRSHSVPYYTPLPVIPLNSHWSERLSCNPTHSSLCRQHTLLVELKHKYRIKS